MHNVQKCERCEALISMRKVVQAGNVVVPDEINPHTRNIRDGRVIKLDVNTGVCTMDLWVCLNEIGPVFPLARTVSGSSVTNEPGRPGTKCSSGGEECHAEQELNGLEEGEDDVRGVDVSQALRMCAVRVGCIYLTRHGIRSKRRGVGKA